MARISDQEVMQYMKEMLSLTITRDDLNNPTKEFVLRLYGEVLNAFGWTRLNQPDLMATNGISDIEALGPMIPCVNTFKVLQKLLPKLHREIDIKLMDILMPEKARTSRIIRELMRMHYKLSDYMDKWSVISEKYVNLGQRHAMADKKIMQLKHSIEEDTMHLSTLKNKSAEQYGQIGRLNDTISKQNIKIEELEMEKKAVCDQENGLKDKNAQLDVDISTLKEEINNLKLSIIASPEKEIAQLNNIEAENEKLKTELESLEENVQKMEQKKKDYKETFALLEGMFMALKSMIVDNYTPIVANQENCDKYRQQIAEIDEQIRKTKTEINSQKASTESVRAQYAKEREKSDREVANLSKLLEGLKAQELEQQQTLENYRQDNQQLAARLNSLKEEFVQLEDIKTEQLAKLNADAREWTRKIRDALR